MRKRAAGAIATVALLAPLVMVLAASAGSPTAVAAGDSQDPAAARSATSHYHRAEVAQQAGYALPPAGPLHECISAADGSAAAMGFHWINSDLVGDAALDVDHPEVLVYEPTKDGRLRLVALASAGHRLSRPLAGPAGLTPREVEVLALLARGATNRQIAKMLGITPKTAGNHVEHVYTKTGVTTRAPAALFAMRHGLLRCLDPID